MFWFMLGGLLIIFSILTFLDNIEEEGIIIFFTGIFIIIISIVFTLNWYKEASKFEVVPQIIANKVAKIQEMRKTYYNPSENVQFNIDMVNKNLAININNEIKELERYINEKNEFLASWHYKYRMKFWFTCFVKPPELFSLQDYLSVK